MAGELLYSRSEMFIAVVLFAVLLGASEAGYRLGRRGRASVNDATKWQVGSIQGAILGLLGLLLGLPSDGCLAVRYPQPTGDRGANAIGPRSAGTAPPL